MGVGLTGAKGFPVCCCEAAKDEALGCLKNSQRPSFLIAASVEILVLPTISGSIIYSLEPSLRKLISDEFDHHLTMLGRSKGLGGFVFQIRDGKDWLNNRYLDNQFSFRFFRSWVGMRFP